MLKQAHGCGVAPFFCSLLGLRTAPRDRVLRAGLFPDAWAVRAGTFPLGKKDQRRREKINFEYKVVSGKD